MEKENKKKNALPGITFTGDITVQGSMFDIHDNQHVYIGKNTDIPNDKPHTEEAYVTKPRDEELFHFVHPEIDEEEAWRIHDAIKRIVKHQKAKEICAYLKELKKERKVFLPDSPTNVYNELKRLGLPTGDGYSEKYFSSCYTK